MQAAWIVDDEGKGEAAEDEDEEEAMEGGVSLDEEAMEAESEDDDNDTDKEGSVISEQDNGRLGLSSRATSVWEGEDDDRSEIMVRDLIQAYIYLCFIRLLQSSFFYWIMNKYESMLLFNGLNSFLDRKDHVVMP
jgi:hypothetical protein